MNNRLLKILTLLSSSIFVISGCSDDNSSFETPSTSTTPENNSPISQNNFTILFSEPAPGFYDPAEGTYSSVTSEISVQIGDNDNQLITGSRNIQFRTEWGLIDPSCTTEDGGCSVTWRSGSPDDMPSNFRNTIIAYSDGGQESYADINGNGIFDDGDTFDSGIYEDVEEPFINIDESYSGGSPTFTTGDKIIDTINGRDTTGANASHDAADGFFNGPNCAHSTKCSTVLSTVTVWESGAMLLNGGVVFLVGGTVSGLTGTLVIENNGSDLTITADGPYGYEILGGLSYDITVKTQPAGQNCVVANASGVPTADVTGVDITCS